MERDRRVGVQVVEHHPDPLDLLRSSHRCDGIGRLAVADLRLARGSIRHLLGFFLVNEIDRDIRLPAVQKARLLWQYAKWRAAHSHNEAIADRDDLGDNIMVPMLGATGCYTCGYLEHEDDDLDRMQRNKIDLIFSKLRLEPGMRVLDAGCGNGGMLVHAALSWRCEGEGFTNSYNMASLAPRN